ncbi:MAG: ComEA family DNA-binding protein [bacterium]
MSKGQYSLTFFLLFLCLLALPGFYRSLTKEKPSGAPLNSDQKLKLEPDLQRRIPNTQIDIQPTTEREKKIIAHQQKININTTNENKLQKLPGIGPSFARRIITHREINGKFTHPEDITNVTSIGSGTYNKIKDKIRTSSTPFVTNKKTSSSQDKININQADQEKLQTLPGISRSIAGDIVKHRQKHGKFNNLDELKAIKGIGRITVISLKKQATAR